MVACVLLALSACSNPQPAIETVAIEPSPRMPAPVPARVPVPVVKTERDLGAVLHDRSSPIHMRLDAVRQLAERQRNIVDNLTSALSPDDDQEVIFQIAMALGDISDPRALPTLQHINQTLQNPSDDLTMALEYAIEHCKVEDHSGNLRAVAILNHKIETTTPEPAPPKPVQPASSTDESSTEEPAPGASIQKTFTPEARNFEHTPHYTETSSGYFAASAIPAPSGLVLVLGALARKSRRRSRG
jgi:hypothetical protein